jgi:hypothetical protein
MDFEFELDLFGVQTCLEKSGEFFKNLIYLDLPEYEFRLAWLYSKNCNFHASSIGLGLKIKEKRIRNQIQTKPSSLAIETL